MGLREHEIAAPEAGAAPVRPPPGAARPAMDVLALQRAAGNRAVSTLLRAPPAQSDYDAAIAARSWGRAIMLLNELGDAELDQRVRALTPAQRKAMWFPAMGMALALGDRVYRTLRFADNGGAVPAAHDPEYAVTSPGTEVHHDTVGGGDVSVRTGLKALYDGVGLATEAFEMEYAGPDAAKTQWLQFAWREIAVEEDLWPDSMLEDVIPAETPYRLTTDPAEPRWIVDVAPGGGSPFYEAAATDNRDPTSTTLLDAPDPLDKLVLREFRGGADRVTSRIHFSTYLVRGMDVLYRVDLTVEWVFERDTHYDETKRRVTVPPRSQTLEGGYAVAAIDPRMRRKLVAVWPDFDYLP
jgi:hypothetical protein